MRVIDGHAVFSPDQRYRYTLSRRLGFLGEGTVLFVGLNPSTATAETNDRTIRRCMGFSQAWGFQVMLMGNIYAFRSTDPAKLPAEPDCVGEENAHYLALMLAAATKVIAAWGGYRLGPEGLELTQLVAASGKSFSLGRNDDGTPCHPLYLSKKTELVPWP